MHEKLVGVQQQLKGSARPMSNMVLQLSYISSCRPDMDDLQVELILSASRLNNRQHDITGFLLFNGRRFLQHLEGPADAVESVYARIHADPRHHALVLLSRQEAEFRAFSRWSMAFERIDGVVPERREALIAQVKAMLSGAEHQVAEHFLGYARSTASKAA